MNYQVMQTKVGWIVQNINTLQIVAGPFPLKSQADFRLTKLNSNK